MVHDTSIGITCMINTCQCNQLTILCFSWCKDGKILKNVIQGCEPSTPGIGPPLPPMITPPPIPVIPGDASSVSPPIVVTPTPHTPSAPTPGRSALFFFKFLTKLLH